MGRQRRRRVLAQVPPESRVSDALSVLAGLGRQYSDARFDVVDSQLCVTTASQPATQEQLAVSGA